MRLWRRFCLDKECSGAHQAQCSWQVMCEGCGVMAPLVEIDMPDADYLAWQQGVEDAEAKASRDWEQAGRAAGGVQ